MGLFDSLVDLAEDVAKIAVAPVEIAVEVTKAVVSPVADVAEELAEDIKDALR